MFDGVVVTCIALPISSLLILLVPRFHPLLQLWVNATTFAHFAVDTLAAEVAADPLLSGGASGNGQSRGTQAGLGWVLKSLTPTHRKILAALLELGGESRGSDNDESDKAGEDGRTAVEGVADTGAADDDWDGAGAAAPPVATVAFDDLLEECRQALLLTKDSQLRTHLVELTDHALVAVKGHAVGLLVPPKRLRAALQTLA